MFYSHELLTSRKHGVATVWLVATLGSRSGLRRVTRKAIQGVDIEKACATVSDGEGQPLALRLQSNLLYGISRVYFQQCEYVLVDAQHAQNSLRTLWKHVVESQGLDPNAGKANPENLIIPDDPGFLPDDIIPDPNFDLSLFDSSVVSSSLPSILSGGHHASSGSNASAIGIEIPSSIFGAAHDTPALPDTGHLSHLEPDLGNDEGFNPNFPFGVDQDGYLFDFPPAAEDVELPTRARSDSHDSARARLAFESDLEGQHILGDAEMTLPGDDYAQVLPDAEPFPTTQRDEAKKDTGPRAQRVRRPIPMDKALQLRNSDLAHMNDNYVRNMLAARKQKIAAKNSRQARKNAFHYVLGRGLGDTGVLRGTLTGPLAQFSGVALYESLTGRDFNASNSILQKRSASPDGEAAPISKRARPEIGRGQHDEGDMLPLFDDSIELGRDAPPLPRYDEHSSQMPWNQPVSSRGGSRAGSVLRSTAGSARGPRSLDRVSGNRRQIPSSPLHGRSARRTSTFRGITTPGVGGKAGNEAEEGPSMLSMPLSGPDASPEGGIELHSPEPGLPSYSPQESPPSQSLRTHWGGTIDADAQRFLAFVSARADTGSVADAVGEYPGVTRATAFHTLIPPAGHPSPVATQAFVHLLTLAHAGCVVTEQMPSLPDGEEQSKNDTDPGIWIGVMQGWEDLQLPGRAEYITQQRETTMFAGEGGVDAEQKDNDVEEGAKEGEEEEDDDASDHGTAQRIARLRF